MSSHKIKYIEPKKLISSLILAIILATLSTTMIKAEEIFNDKKKGIELYNQYKALSAIPYLRNAAKQGDTESRYYLGEALKNKSRYITPEAAAEYTAAANQGDVYSMIRLGQMQNDLCNEMKNCPVNAEENSQWRKKAKIIAGTKAAEGNSEYMYLLYIITGDDSWLGKSAEHGYALAQYLLATKYRDGKGVFILSSSRGDVIEKWMKASAEGGYPQGMMGYAAILFNKKDLKGYRYWNEKAAEAGYASAVFGLGVNLSKKTNEYGFEIDLVKAYALISLLQELNGGGAMQDNVDDVLPIIGQQMSKEQISEAEKFKMKWKLDHPPLSFFPEKLRF